MKNKIKNIFTLKNILRIFVICIFLFVLYMQDLGNKYNNCMKIATQANQQGQTQKAKDYYNKAIKLTFGHNPYPLLELGKIYSFEGDYSKAEPLLKKSFEISKRSYKIDDSRAISFAHALAILYAREGKYSESEQLYNYALNLVNESDIKTKAELLDDLGGLYLNTKNYKKAEEYLTKSLNLRKKIYTQMQMYQNGMYINLGILYINTGKYKQAEEILQNLLKVCNSNDCSDSFKLNIYINITTLYLKKLDISKAESYANKAEKLYNNNENLHNPSNELALVMNIAVIASCQGDTSKSSKFFNKALNLAIQNYGKNSHEVQNIEKTILKVKKMEDKQ